MFNSGMLFSQSPFVDKAITFEVYHNYTGNNAGGGVSCVDFNLDGLDDISLAAAAGHHMKFFLNKGTGEFVELNLVPENLFEIKQLLWIDYDNDGDKDLFAAAFDGVNKLYRNNGSLNLQDVSITAGIPQDTTRTIGANFADYNRDGWLDLYYCERSLLGANTINQNRLFKNNGDGTFQDVSLVTNTSDKDRLPFCSVFADFNNDKWPDIYIANDRKRRNTLLINFSGFYVDASIESGTGLEMEAMCTAIGDYNKDGLMDAYVSNNIEGNKFFVNNPDSTQNPYPIFTEKAEELGISVNSNCWGALLFDSNNDTNLDLYVSSALVGLDTIQSVLFEQSDEGEFIPNQNPMDGDTVSSFNNAIGDFNTDGFSDIVVMNKFPYNINVWENQNDNNDWIKIHLTGILSNRDAIGSKLEIYQTNNYQQLYTTSAIGFMGQNSNQYIFGLGENNIIDSLIITWPTGHEDKFIDLAPNSLNEFYEGQSTGDFIYVDSDVSILIDTINNDTMAIDSISYIKDSFTYSYQTCFPNPATTTILIDIPMDISQCLIEAYNLNGIVHTLKGSKNEINISPLDEGYYLLKVKYRNDIYHSKFLKIN